MDVAKIIENIVNTLDLPEVDLPRTSKRVYQRRLCLYVLGFDPTPDTLLDKVKSMALAGRNSEAALYALLAGNLSLAATALRSGPRQSQNKALSLLLSLRASKSESSSLLPQITSTRATEKDPYSLGILSLLTGETTTAPPSLPPIYQLGLAVKLLPDPALRSYVANTFNKATASGNLAYLPLTGLTHLCLRLFENYLARSSDLQSVVLALSHVSPLYFRNPNVDAWRSEYRHLLNNYGLHIKRAQFDMQSTKLATTWDGQKKIEPERRQVTLKCGNCDGPLHREQEDVGSSKVRQQPQKPSHGRKSSGNIHHPSLTSISSDLSTMTTSTTQPPGTVSAENSFTSIDSGSTETIPSAAGSLPSGATSVPIHSLPQPPPSAPPIPTISDTPGSPVTTPAPTTTVTPVPTTGGPPQHRVFGGPRDGTMCPNCGARLPRCAVCDFWVGEVDPRSKGARSKKTKSRSNGATRKEKPTANEKDGTRENEGQEKEDNRRPGSPSGSEGEVENSDYESDRAVAPGVASSRRNKKDKEKDPLAGFVEICLSCRHVYHRSHAKEWFAKHAQCAARGCRCLCGSLDGSVGGRRSRRV